MSYAIPKEEEDDGGEILDGTGYGLWGRVSKSTLSYDTEQCITVLIFDIARLPLRASEVTRLLA